MTKHSPLAGGAARPLVPPAMGDLLKLAERCEAATGPDRELDLAIDCVVRPTEWSAKVQETLSPGCPLEWFDDEELPEYTASLDAAMTLVPEGHWFLVGKETGPPWARCYDVEQVYGAPEEYGELREAATPALALCAAALRARAAQ